ncbi:hypothetical protein M3197_08480 [Sporosarcina aquimarina]|uniref:hypothetical protein n=1 Tax=Sporosarcina aquimarina TaxID=114975 RepID=UPI00203DFE0F|nr:hypothetical protein [Sporosarcina aquimarina]MCM3757524.1 hypothetical protein [Sporosarcina aquimarina]
MGIILFVVSYILLNMICSALYVGFLLLLFKVMKKTFTMNEEKWTTLFNYKEGLGLRFMMMFPFLITSAVMFPVSIYSFNLINFKYTVLGYFAVIMLPATILVFHLPKLNSTENKGSAQDLY